MENKNGQYRRKIEQALLKISNEDLAIILHKLNRLIYYWLDNPNEARIKTLFRNFPVISEFISIDAVLARLIELPSLEKYGHPFGVHITEFIPELLIFLEEAGSKLDSLPKNIKKAELWLLPFAIEAEADADLEASIYFASRGRTDVFDSNEIETSWHAAICDSIERGRPLATRVTEDVMNRAKARTLSLKEAAAILEFHGELPIFLAARKEESDFILATFFRSIEWLGIKGFDEWTDSYISEFEASGQNGFDPKFFSWTLFFICRSNLALTKINPQALNSLLWLFNIGNIERDQPWKQYSWTANSPEIIDHLPIASALVFAKFRTKNTTLADDLIEKALTLIISIQKSSGGWPIKSDDTDSSIIATCFAIHALALGKPKGWEKCCLRGKNWLIEQQRQSGCWHIDGAPTVMLTVFVLDAINLAEESKCLTFKLGSVEQTDAINSTLEPIYDFSSTSWYGKDFPTVSSIDFNQAYELVTPQVALVVAVETELRQTLQNLKPIAGHRKILKVAKGGDTYYLGKFGAFSCVVTMCAMGSEGPGGATLTAYDLMNNWNPKGVILEGIAFGIDREKQLPGDVLVSDMILPYENQRVGDEIRTRSPVPPSSIVLLNRFKNAINWKFKRPDNTLVKKHIGPILSGGKLVDNLPFKNQLMKLFPTAIGGEMEGSGLWAAADRHGTPWIVVKAVCDWGDGKKHKQYQELAAASAASICLSVLKDRNALNGL